MHVLNKVILFVMSYRMTLYKIITIGNLRVSDFILKLYAHDIFLFELSPLRGTKWFPFHACMSNGKDKEF